MPYFVLLYDLFLLSLLNFAYFCVFTSPEKLISSPIFQNLISYPCYQGADDDDDDDDSADETLEDEDDEELVFKKPPPVSCRGKRSLNITVVSSKQQQVKKKKKQSVGERRTHAHTMPVTAAAESDDDDDETVDEDEDDSESLFSQVKGGKMALLTTIDEWIDTYKKHKSQAMVQLIQLFVQACGCR